MQTFSVKPQDIKKKWVVVDATGKPLGRLASEVARILRGKDKASFTPYIDCGDNVLILNAKKISLSGNKMQSKTYFHHTNYIGGIKAARAEEILQKHPERLIQTAVKGMLPKNKLARTLMTNLRIYAGTDHPHTAQAPTEANLDRLAGTQYFKKFSIDKPL